MTARTDCLSETLRHHREVARQVQKLDDELGLHHGISWNDLLLLDSLHEAGGRLSVREAAAVTCRSPAGLLRQVLPMEKIGLVQRERDTNSSSRLALTAAGERQMREARASACALLEDVATSGL